MIFQRFSDSPLLETAAKVRPFYIGCMLSSIKKNYLNSNGHILDKMSLKKQKKALKKEKWKIDF